MRAALLWGGRCEETVFPWPHEMPLFALDMAGRKGCGSIEGLQNLHAEINPYKVIY